jgi:hypothetical protein
MPGRASKVGTPALAGCGGWELCLCSLTQARAPTASAGADGGCLWSAGPQHGRVGGCLGFVHPRRGAMKRSILATAFAMASVLTSGLLMAQTTSQSMSPPPASSPPASSSDGSATTNSQAPHGSSSSSQGSMSGDIHSQLKTCIAQARAQNPSMSEHAAKKACKAQSNSGSTPQ